MPLGAHATLAQGTLSLTAVVLSLDGSRAVRASAQGTAKAARALGDTAAEQLLAAGAETLLAEAHARLEGRSRA
jgi:hydroxymethylbilane synthase